MAKPRASTICDNLRAARRAERLSYVELGAKLGTKPVTVSRWESGEFQPSTAARPALVAWARSLPAATGEPLLRALGFDVPAPPAPAPSASPAVPPRRDRERAANDAVLAMAERLDIGPRSLRRALTTLLAECESEGIDLATLRTAAARSLDAKRRGD